MGDYIFLSYRRADGADKARLLKLFLNKLGYNVFMDQDGIDTTNPFPIELKRKVEQCKDFVLILTEQAKAYKSGAQDWLYEEMETAYECRNDIAIHTATVDEKYDFKAFGENAPPAYKEAVDHIRLLTPLQILDFSGTDKRIIANIDSNVKSRFKTKPDNNSIDGRAEDVQTVYSVDDKECNRLARQSSISYEKDKSELSGIIERLREGDEKRKLTVLDVGCAHGETGKRYFGDDSVFGKVVGIDYDTSLICSACKNSREPRWGRFIYEEIDVTSDRFGDMIDAVMRREGIDGFDIVFCCQVLHHVANRRKAIANLKDRLRAGGCFIIRGSDDGTKILYQKGAKEDNNDLIPDIVKLTTSLKTVADRFYGRKIYSDLKVAELEDITVMPITTASSMYADDNEKNKFLHNEYRSSFLWRKDIFVPRKENTKAEIADIEQKGREMNEKIDRINLLFTQGCWYSSTDYFGYGFKERD